MTWNVAMHALGWASLITIAGVSLAIIADSLVPNWARIWDTACGRPWPIARHPFSPTASVLPLRTSVPPLRAVEADAQLTDKAA
ncbi:hypothetical protein E5673_12725 [Sphingomonas sp. PAMC26645]|uniref:hypothetical protein n=1 Tax=Sphingomonas sp. PAMC26645 TaxID=2565555 RepID=UPI00109DF98F|nr:hypothetical protein [Sphingomonas sp. PAMC26645]QCB42972.1 hypothetical protein E5673_12725 [Sphingomonas sp. PAMC26645]